MIRTNRLVHRLALTALAFNIMALPLIAAAQWSAVQATPTASASKKDTNIGDLKKLEPFLRTHPRVAKDLKDDPALANNPDYLSKHPGLKEFLSTRHSGASAPARARPEPKSLDQFFEGHPMVAEELRKNPSLLDDQTYLANHPGLQQFLKSHPEARKDLKAQAGGAKK